MNELIEILKHYSPLISIFTFFLGLYIGNKQAIGRDKRKEFNNYAEPIIKYFDYMRSWFEKQTINTASPLPTSAINCLMRRLSIRKQKRFENLLNEYLTTFNKLISHKGKTDDLYHLALAQVADIKRFLRLK
ncbi:MAG TPA: hypothetical protein ACHBX6_11555 [Arsenophonus nasoniae]|uniref:hypothetical protein n=1 Tax=Arsenophonus nasoniae TaxID=638 RepID=UPI0038792174